jgi:hypothetical protein
VDDLQVFLPVHVGALAAVWPEDVSGVPQYDGTSHSRLGLTRTKTISLNDWRDSSNAANMLLLAAEYLGSVKDVAYEGSIPYYGLLSDVLAIGHALNIAGNGYDTGWESLAVPIVSVDLQYQERGGATHYVTTLSFSNRRAPFSGAALQRPAMTGAPFGLADGAVGLASGLVDTRDQISNMFGPAYQAGQQGLSESQDSASVG